jgi:UDP-N-acetylmuramyl pentapeptide phosphotransferase/UDP-N-acetylglucosamine-1-phosphate transferase
MIGNITFIIATFLVSFVCGIITIPQITSFCKKKELYDMPNLRKVHTTNIPRMGGTCFMPCMIVAALLSVAVYRFNNDETLTISLWSFMFLVTKILVTSFILWITFCFADPFDMIFPMFVFCNYAWHHYTISSTIKSISKPPLYNLCYFLYNSS